MCSISFFLSFLFPQLNFSANDETSCPCARSRYRICCPDSRKLCHLDSLPTHFIFITWAFAWDNALLLSRRIGHLNELLEVPLLALFANAFVVFLPGFIHLESSTAFNAFIRTPWIVQQLTFILPALLLMANDRSTKHLKTDRFVNLGAFGWVRNAITVLWGILTLIFYCFSSDIPIQARIMSRLFLFSFKIISWILSLTNTFSRLQRMRDWGNGAFRCSLEKVFTRSKALRGIAHGNSSLNISSINKWIVWARQ